MYMRFWDYVAASRVDAFVANSEFIAKRIRKCYGRDAEVNTHTVDVYTYIPVYHKEDYYLAASRLVPYKRVDLLSKPSSKCPIASCFVAGDGPIVQKAESHRASQRRDAWLPTARSTQKLMQRAKGFVFAAEEDFASCPSKPKLRHSSHRLISGAAASKQSSMRNWMFL